MKGKTIVVPNYVSHACSCVPARYDTERKMVCQNGSQWDEGKESSMGECDQCVGCEYRVDISEKHNLHTESDIREMKDAYSENIRLLYKLKPRTKF